MSELIIPHYTPLKTDIIVRYEKASHSGEAFHEWIVSLSTVLEKDHGDYTRLLRLFDINQATKEFSVAINETLFSEGDMIQQLQVMKEIFSEKEKNDIKIINIQWNRRLIASFQGPQQGIDGIRKVFSIENRPLICGILNPDKNGMSKSIIEQAYHMWMGGCDMVAEQQSLKNSDMSEFEDRLSYISKEMTNCSKRTETLKTYIPSISGKTWEEIVVKIQKAEKYGLRIMRIHIDVIGYSGLASLSKQFGTRGIAFLIEKEASSQLDHHLQFRCLELAGADIQRYDDIKNHHKGKKSAHNEQSIPLIKCESSYEQIESLIKHHGDNLIIESQRLISNHPDGIKEGSKALLEAVTAASSGIEQRSASKKNLSLKKALIREEESKEIKMSL